MEGGNDPFGEVLMLRGKVKDLTRSLENQTALLHDAEDELRSLRAEMEARAERDDGAGQDAAGASEAAARRAALEKEVYRLTQARADLANQNALLLQEVHERSAQVQQRDEIVSQRDAEISRLEGLVSDLKSLSGRLGRDVARLESDLAERDARIRTLEDDVRDREDTLGGLDRDYHDVQAIKADAKQSHAALTQLRAQLTLVSQRANEKISAMQNELMGYREFHRNQVTEFQRFVEEDRIARQEFEERYLTRYRELRDEYTAFREAQYDEKRQMLRDHQDILQSMQSQFDEYRTTAEFLFNAEAAKLEEKLNLQMLKFDQEIKYVVRTKDAHFDEMVAMKDAKIMNLIEGTDLRTMLIKHQTELDGLARSHQRELDRQRVKAESDVRRAVSDLEVRVASHALELERHADAKRSLESKLSESRAKIAEHAAKLQNAHEAHGKELALASKREAALMQRVQQVSQERERYRHRALRLSLRMRSDAAGIAGPGPGSGGPGGVPLEQLCARLSAEMASLRAKYESLLAGADLTRAEAAVGAERLQNAQRASGALRAELMRRTRAYAELADAYAELLAYAQRAHVSSGLGSAQYGAGVAGGGSQSGPSIRGSSVQSFNAMRRVSHASLSGASDFALAGFSGDITRSGSGDFTGHPSSSSVKHVIGASGVRSSTVVRARFADREPGPPNVGRAVTHLRNTLGAHLAQQLDQVDERDEDLDDDHHEETGDQEQVAEEKELEEGRHHDDDDDHDDDDHDAQESNVRKEGKTDHGLERGESNDDPASETASTLGAGGKRRSSIHREEGGALLDIDKPVPQEGSKDGGNRMSNDGDDGGEEAKIRAFEAMLDAADTDSAARADALLHGGASGDLDDADDAAAAHQQQMRERERKSRTGKAAVKVRIPKRTQQLLKGDDQGPVRSGSRASVGGSSTVAIETLADLERAQGYLHRFQRLSRAFHSATTARAVMEASAAATAGKGSTDTAQQRPYERVKLYGGLDGAQEKTPGGNGGELEGVYHGAQGGPIVAEGSSSPSGAGRPRVASQKGNGGTVQGPDGTARRKGMRGKPAPRVAGFAKKTAGKG